MRDAPPGPPAGAFDLAPYRPAALDDLVRVGRDGDGGYVVSRRSVRAARVLVGLGINDDWSFEAGFGRLNPGARVVGVDGSVSPDGFREQGRADVARAMAEFFDGRARHFVPRFFAPDDGPPHNEPGAVGWATLCRTFDLLAGGDARSGPCDVFVKMDVEGAEYRTLAGVLASAERLAGAVVEFHGLDRHWADFAALMGAAAPALAVGHLHGNNYGPLVPGTRTPSVLEVSFVNRRLLEGPAVPSAGRLPRPGLDQPCDPGAPDYELDVGG